LGMVSSLLTSLLRGPLAGYRGRRVVELIVGARFTLAVLDTGHVGVAYTPEYWDPLGDEYSSEPSLEALARRADEGPLHRAAALAAFSAATNAWIDSGGRVRRCESIVAELGVSKGDRVMVVGFMRRVAEEAAARGARVIVAERSPQLLAAARSLGFSVIGDADAPEYAGEVDHLIVTGSSLLYPGLLLALLREAAGARSRALIGPTANLHPAAIDLLGLTHIGGSFAPREASSHIRRRVMQGHGYHGFSRFMVKWVAGRGGGSG